EEMGLDVLISDNRFLDVLPQGVSKGPTLTRLVDHLGLDHARVLTAGDTLNDLSMLTAGFRAVAVGKSEPALIEQLGGHDSAYLARQEGVAGIAEAILHYGFLNK
ncbi:MAG: HAD family hydrolase, partial [Pseudomonadota bacterium]